MTVFMFRSLVVIYIIAIMLGYLIPLISEPSSAEVTELFLQDGLDAVVDTNVPTFLVLLVSNILIPLGLYYFNSVARVLFALFTLVTIVFILLWGYRITSPVVSMLGFIAALLQGAILAAAYFSTLSDRFGESHSLRK